MSAETLQGLPFVTDADASWEAVAPGVRRKVLCYDTDLMVVRVDFAAGAVGAPHRHQHRQCSLVENGTFDVTVGGVTRRLGAGDTFLAQPDVEHGVVAVEAGTLVDVFTPMREDFVERR